ncbi:excisionase family protein, partial [Oleiphilus sp. HI0123]|uniref:excisionase family protein n=2 Tax=Oleiphilus TaxID=141450 RepID=UPI000AC9D307
NAMNRETNISIQYGRWVHQKILEATHGFTNDQLKKYRCAFWLEGKHFIRNPANRIVYNPVAIDDWMEGKL